MIRFEPDSLFEAAMRPFAMAAPNGGVYAEIIAPDFRLAFAVVLLGAGVLLGWRHRRDHRGVLLLALLTALAFVPWLATSGNGRYFMAFLLLAGPLCVGAARLLPGSAPMKLVVAVAMLAWQLFLAVQTPPWRSWGYVDWGSRGVFPIDVPADVAAQPQVYVTMSSITYSIIAPRFHPASRWVNLAALPGGDRSAVDVARAHAVIGSGMATKLVFPTVPGGQKGERLDPELALAIDQLLAVQRLSIENASACRLLKSDGMKAMVSRRGSEPDPSMVHGFWLCPLALHANPAAVQKTTVPERTEAAFAKLEATCPRIFRRGEAISLRIPDGAVRGYPGSDFKVYILDNGEVWYKYYRALNRVMVGTVDQVLAPGFGMDCEHITGRGALPWDRSI